MSISLIFRGVNFSVSLPLRKVVKAKSKKQKHVQQQQQIGVTRYLPYIPPETVRDTITVLKDRESLSEILDLIFSPLTPVDTFEDRQLYQRVVDVYRLYKESIQRRYQERELHIRDEIFNAIKHLPSELYEEAVRSQDETIPEELAFNQVYRNQLINSSLSQFELDKLDVYRMLMYLRFPHLDIKRRNPGLFWLEEKKMISRQKQASLLAKKKS